MALNFEDPWGLPTSEPLGVVSDATGISSHNTSGNGNVSLPSSDTDLSMYTASIRTSFNPLGKDIVEITELPEKEGVLMFKHTNYLVQHLVDLPDSEQSVDRKVIRRYSDFDWLHQTLLTKYPFRLIPDLPPKRLGSTADEEFLVRRLKGLVRFINQIMKHPILSQEQLVVMFLTVPTDLSSWRKQATYDTTEEFEGRKISIGFVELWNANLDIFQDVLNVESVNLKIVNCLENWSKLTVLVERFMRRYEQIASDDLKFNKIMNSFNDPGNLKLFNAFGDSDIAEISENLSLVSLKFKEANDVLEESNTLIKHTTLEKFKNFNDYLISLKLLIDRFETKGGNQIPMIQSRIQMHQSKLNELNKKADVKGFEVDKLNNLISNDQKLIDIQTHRDWLIKQSLLNELIVFQECQYQITDCAQDLIANYLKVSELQSNNWSSLVTSIQDMPLARHR